MSSMFANSPFNQFIEEWDVANVTDMSSMFENSPFNEFIGDWDVSGVTDMSSMFENSPFNQPISGWNVSNVTNMGSMFAGTPFDQYIDNWNVLGVTSMSNMFYNTSFNQPLSGWNVSNVTQMNGIFLSATSFNQNISNWAVTGLTYVNSSNSGLKQAFNNCVLNTLNYSNILINWSSLPGLQSSIVMGATGLNYTISTAGTSRALLTRTNQSLVISNCVNNGSGLIRVTSAAQTLVTGNKVIISGVLGTTEANGSWIVTVINSTTIVLQGSAFVNTYTSGGTLRTGCGWTIVGDTGV
jgi:surface protein